MSDIPHRSAQLATLAAALEDLRDTWQLLAMVLQERLTDSPSEERDAALVQAKLQLDRIWHSGSRE